MNADSRWLLTRILAELQRRSAPTPFERYAHDPVAFVRESIGEELWSEQAKISESVRDFKRTAVKSGFGVGKSQVASRIVAWWLSTRRNAIAFTTAPTGRQVRNILWRKLRAAHRRGGLPGTCLTDRWEIEEEWYAFGTSPRDYDPASIQGIHAPEVLVVIDEADGVPRQIWQACEGLIVGERCRILAIGNPEDPTGPFADCFGRDADMWNRFTISCFDSPNITGELEIPGLVDQAWVDDQKRRGMEGTPFWLSRVLGEFPEGGADTLIAIRVAERALDRPNYVKSKDLPRLKVAADAPVMVGVDVARYGPDDSVVVVMRGGVQLLHMWCRHGRAITETADEAARAAKKFGAARIRVDTIGGLGAGVVDILEEKRRKGAFQAAVDPINVSLDARDDERFFNLRSELWWELKEDLEAGNLDLSACPADLRLDLIRDLTSPRYTLRTGTLYVEEKKDLKARRIPSPDRADAIMLARAPGGPSELISFVDLDDDDDDWDED